MTGKKPEFKAVIKVAEKRWNEVGAAWVRDKGNVSVQLQTMPLPVSGKINFLLVPNRIEESA